MTIKEIDNKAYEILKKLKNEVSLDYDYCIDDEKEIVIFGTGAVRAENDDAIVVTFDHIDYFDLIVNKFGKAKLDFFKTYAEQQLELVPYYRVQIIEKSDVHKLTEGRSEYAILRNEVLSHDKDVTSTWYRLSSAAFKEYKQFAYEMQRMGIWCFRDIERYMNDIMVTP